MYDAILVPTDGSEGTAKTLDNGVEMARHYDAAIHALAVVDERQYEPLDGDEPVIESAPRNYFHVFAR